MTLFGVPVRVPVARPARIGRRQVEGRGYQIRVRRARPWSLLHGWTWTTKIHRDVCGEPLPIVWASGTAMTHWGARKRATRAADQHLAQRVSTLRAAR